MNNHDWEQFGDDIRRTIQDAVDYGNYERLNQNITNTVNQVRERIRNSAANVYRYGKTQYQQPSYSVHNYQQSQYNGSTMGYLQKFKANGAIKVPGILFSVFGYPISSFFFLVVIACIMKGIVDGELLIGLIAATLMAGVFGGFLVVAIIGSTMLIRGNRFDKYVSEIGNAEFCNIKQLAQRVQKTDAFVVKDIERMIRKRWFKQGYLDRNKTCLIVTRQMYEQYCQLERRKDIARQTEQEEQQKKVVKRQGLGPDVHRVIEQGEVYIKRIRECNEAIPGKEISEKIFKLEQVVDRIFDRIEQEPSLVNDVRKLLEYYLPTTVKLLKAYIDMDSQPVQGENIVNAKKEIEATLDTLNIAFEKLLDDLFQDTAWDVSSDISVLNTILSQEGLKEDGLLK